MLGSYKTVSVLQVTKVMYESSGEEEEGEGEEMEKLEEGGKGVYLSSECEG